MKLSVSARLNLALWVIMVALFPITSLPLLVRLVGSDTVAAPSGVLLLLLVSFWLLPYIWRGGQLPRQTVVLLWLAGFALLTTALSHFREVPAYKGMGMLPAQAKALLTLAVGLCFYWLSATWPQKPDRLRLTLQVINWSGLALIAWSLAQAAAWYSLHRYPDWMRSLQELVSVGTLFRQRINGFTLEPSWLAHQLNMLYLPFWMAASLRRYSAHSRRIYGVSFENLLLAAGMLVLFLTLSRVGLAAFLLIVAYMGLRLGLWLWSRLRARFGGRTSAALSAISLAGMVLFLMAAAVVVGIILSRLDPRMRTLFQFDWGRENPILYYATQLSFSARMVYWQAGWKIFNDFPFWGVGLGNAGFYFPEAMSAYSWKLVEVHDLFYRTSTLLNIKSLWVRLLAETGIVGFSLFIIWLLLHWLTARYLEQSQQPIRAVLGWAGQLVLIGFLIEGFSVDSFAFPYLWFTMGLLAAGWQQSGRLYNGGIEERTL